jgi:hypothetical protein
MKDKRLAQPLEDLFRNFGIPLSPQKREELRRALEAEKEKFAAVDRVHGQDRKRERDVSR